ncbi:unnamed protein product, partial [Oppiella nova]
MWRNSLYFYLHQGYMVEMFTVITGFLTSYSILNKLSRDSSKFNYITHVLKIYLKTTLVMIGHLIIVHILDTIGEGPHWKRFGQMNYIQNCDNFFDNYILHIQNYRLFNRNILNMCAPYAYYLCVYIHLSILAP